MFTQFMIMVAHPSGEKKYVFDTMPEALKTLAVFKKDSIPAALYTLIEKV